MNERIRELAEHANYLATEKEFPYDDDWFYVYNKKFAGLIVRECIDILDDEDDGEDTGRSVRIAMIRIKKHFGVE